ncbi:hypothetical protein PUNSTDRAFT_134264 [Punctularia strigosozonata HHB-11173 SS5]|uniref:uncharacterized protein n=1 Tax=Punctularia strigosozonata (strain HHB-11173) TaxID=741275 RepID=UPI0004416291|nr:uncharacterized protein PUNSTDRAFT_134264 [Punctularia strigosozonata HHB-11173 SS5]EIN09092.1 hypothetical protein PUNSTDRAFT_134264 [Punctularia strigosozonata HHB-11173 SS5]
MVKRKWERIAQNMLTDNYKVLVTASMHDAVDDIVERFIKLNEAKELLPPDRMIRVATDYSKAVTPTRTRGYVLEQAKKRVKESVVVFTTQDNDPQALDWVRSDPSTSTSPLVDKASQGHGTNHADPVGKGAVAEPSSVQLQPTIGLASLSFQDRDFIVDESETINGFQGHESGRAIRWCSAPCARNPHGEPGFVEDESAPVRNVTWDAGAGAR